MTGSLRAVDCQIMVNSIRPRISYVTFMNAFLSFSLLVIRGTVVINLMVGACEKSGDSAGGDRGDRNGRWIFPLVCAALTSLAAAIAFLLYRP